MLSKKEEMFYRICFASVIIGMGIILFAPFLKVAGLSDKITGSVLSVGVFTAIGSIVVAGVYTVLNLKISDLK